MKTKRIHVGLSDCQWSLFKTDKKHGGRQSLKIIPTPFQNHPQMIRKEYKTIPNASQTHPTCTMHEQYYIHTIW